ncbi:41244_t:CDS:2 [Gigaspora margarita]|uniref:41244_t:CDS:1 n=1 Tax=Gigaspora margarita TaxID=4874 RepID=A0ABN7UE34_GIGMA|nr:41244_t:CDS:2 [Gigaspora margarita]
MTFYINKYNIPNSINNVHENEITLGFSYLNLALDINSCDVTTLLYRGEAYFKLGHYYKAFYDLEKVLEQFDDVSYSSGLSLEIKSNYANAMTFQAKICFNLQWYEETI